MSATAPATKWGDHFPKPPRILAIRTKRETLEVENGFTIVSGNCGCSTRAKSRRWYAYIVTPEGEYLRQQGKRHQLLSFNLGTREAVVSAAKRHLGVE